jgi:hypothetical protein
VVLFVIAAAGLLLLPLVGCHPRLRDDPRIRKELQKTYPGFRIVGLVWGDDRHFGPPGWDTSSAGYDFALESEEVPGFRLEGTYNLSNSGGVFGWGARASMLKALTKEQRVALERMWVTIDGGRLAKTPVLVGDGSITGPVTKADWLQVSSRYAGFSLIDVYCLNCQRGIFFFKLDRSKGDWRYLPGFSKY